MRTTGPRPPRSQGAKTKPRGLRVLASSWLLGVLAVTSHIGCATVERARDAQDPAKAIPGERTPTAKELGVPTKGPLTLAEVERTTMRAHPGIVESFRQLEAA